MKHKASGLASSFPRN